MKWLLRIVGSTALLVMIAFGTVACGDDDDATPQPPVEEATSTPEAEPSPTSEPTAAPEPTAEPTATTAPEPTATAVPESGDVLVYLLDGETLVVGGREAATEAAGADAVQALLDGPLPGFEQDLGWSTAIPEGTRLNGIVVEDGTATVDLSAEFESGGGTLSVTARLAQLVFTLTQFDGVDEVDVAIDGEVREFITGEGVPSIDLSRDDFLVPDLARAPIPLILVESPYVGEAIEGSTLRIAGLSNTFEATVRYQVTDVEGAIVIDDFTTATAGTGTWGTFEVEVELPRFVRDGVASVIVFEESAEDGSPVNLVEVPIVVQGG